MEKITDEFLFLFVFGGLAVDFYFCLFFFIFRVFLESNLGKSSTHNFAAEED